MTHSLWLSPAGEGVEVTECGRFSFLCDRETKGVTVTIDVDAVEYLVMTGCVALSPETVTGAGIVYASSTFECCNY